MWLGRAINRAMHGLNQLTGALGLDVLVGIQLYQHLHSGSESVVWQNATDIFC
jgi:hypothetical protein